MASFRIVIWIVLLAAVLAAGCSQGDPEGQGTGSPDTGSQARQETTAEGEETRGGAATGGETTSGGESTSGREGAFTVAPEMRGGSEGAADGLLEVEFSEHEGYERAEIRFGSGDGPAAQVPAWSLSSPTGEGYARITFPGVGTTSVPDGTFGGSILDGFYVVRASAGGVFVDIFATGAFQYRVAELSDPGRLVVDYRPAEVPLGIPLPARSQTTVLFEPREGESVSSPLTVSGYSRNFEGSNTLALIGPDGGVLSRGNALSNDWAETWGYFETTLEFPAFQGTGILRAGTESPRDGSFQGVEVPVAYDRG